jgi:putrescine transport system ATP-binding protein
MMETTRTVSEPVIRIESLGKSFDGHPVVDDVTIDIRRGEIFVILGASGCGKTTLLRMLAGFERPDRGRVLIDGVDMTHAPPYARPVNMMFQSYAVFPHMTVAQNIGYGLRKEGRPKPEIDARVAEMVRLVKLDGLERRKPAQLSGGQRQRVALARALAKRPRVLLLDEPLAALDRKLREHTQFELGALQDQLGITFLVVTHDQEEAMTLATRIAVMDRGRFVQVDTPNRIYEYPANRFVAEFVGTTNLLECQVRGSDAEGLVLDCPELGATLLAGATAGVSAGEIVWLAVRPEKIQISKEPPPGNGRCVVPGVVADLAYYGGRSLYRVRTAAGRLLQVSAQNRVRAAERMLEWDQQVYLAWDRAAGAVLRE